jgi:ferredoxin
MPDINERLPENTEGRFYVDSTCIDCDNCRQTAPTFFRRHEDIGSSYVFRQPETQEEIDQCLDAMEGCPTESIGDCTHED